jgi:aminopeptidase N
MSTPRMLTRNRLTAARATAMVQFFADRIAEAPYPTLTVAALDDNLPGGHSPAYLVALHQALPTTPYSWSDDPVAFENQYPNFFLAHEIAHQWWGQAVGWRNYHEQWLSEGLSQYFAVLFAAADRGPDLLDALIKKMRETSQGQLDQGPISLGYRIGHIENDGRAFRSILYNKAAVVLHMLRRFIGDEAFFGGLRRFYAERRFSKAGTDQLQAAFEAGTTLSLDRFFDKWVRGFTLPRIRVTWREADAGATAVVRVEQDEADVFDFPLTVELQYRNGGSEFRTLPVVGAAFETRLSLSGPLRRVEVKDDLTYFKKR